MLTGDILSSCGTIREIPPFPTILLTRLNIRTYLNQSQAIKVNVTDHLIFTSGQLPLETDGTLNLDEPIEVHTEKCILNIKHVLEAGGSSLASVIKTVVFLTDMADFAKVNRVYERHFTGKPARSCIAVKQLPKGAPVEIECIAVATSDKQKGDVTQSM